MLIAVSDGKKAPIEHPRKQHLWIYNFIMYVTPLFLTTHSLGQLYVICNLQINFADIWLLFTALSQRPRIHEISVLRDRFSRGGENQDFSESKF